MILSIQEFETLVGAHPECIETCLAIQKMDQFLGKFRIEQDFEDFNA